jgi:hypothetical protein
VRVNEQTAFCTGPGRRQQVSHAVKKLLPRTALAVFGLALAIGPSAPATAAEATTLYPSMAPLERYRIASQSEEIALARSAAPASISKDAGVMVLGDHGYDTAVKGTNGFVCLVQRSWSAPFGDPVFWNPRIRGPICLNPAAVSSVLPAEMERTQWVLAGVAKAEMLNRTKSSAAANKPPAPGSIGYMMSRQGYLSDTDGHWHPHLMFFESRTSAASWGANLPGSPVLGGVEGPEPTTVFFVPVANWSDGTSATADQH